MMPDPSGLLAPGNIDLHHRPVVKNPDGTVSTVRSIGVGIDGREVLIPTVSDDGRVLSDAEALAQFRKTGRHLGMFDTPAHATTYAQQLHEQQAKEYGVPDPQPTALHGIVQRMVEAGEPEENIALVIQHYKPPAPAAPVDAYQAMKKETFDRLTGNNAPKMSAPTMGATLGGLAMGAATGGLGAIPAIAATVLAGAGGAGYGLLVRGLKTGDYGTPGGNAATMAVQGGAQGLGEGIGRWAGPLADKIVPAGLKTILNPSKTLQREYPDLVETMRAEQIPIGGSQVAGARARESARKVEDVLREADNARPRVRGYLPPARGEVPLGPPPTPGDMPMRVSEAGALRLLRPPQSPVTGKRFAEFHPGDPEELVFASRLDSTGHPIQPLPSPELGGPGVMYRSQPNAAGPGAHGNMVDPRELVSQLQTLRRDVGNRPMGQDATAELDDLIGRLMQQRNVPLTLSQTNDIKRQAQKLADTAYRAADRGAVVNSIDAGFNKGVATGARRAIEQRVPEVADMNARTQSLGGLEQALGDAELRPHHLIGVNPLHWAGALVPGAASKGAFLTDNAVKGMSTPTAKAIRQAILALLAGESDQQP